MDFDPNAEEKALEEFVANNRKDLEHRVRRAGIPDQDCADVVQEALASATHQLHRGLFRRASSLGTWIHVILGGKVLDYWKLGYRRHFGSALQIETGQELLLPTESAARYGLSQDLQIAVREALSLLEPRERLLLVLQYYEEFTVAEIAASLHWSERQVERVLARARGHLRQIILSGANPGPHRLIEKGEE